RPGVSVCSWRSARISSRGGSPFVWVPASASMIARSARATMVPDFLEVLLHDHSGGELGQGLRARDGEGRAVEDDPEAKLRLVVGQRLRQRPGPVVVRADV